MVTRRRRTRQARQQQRWERLGKLLLTVGFLAVALATVVAWLNPAKGYELSIYAKTPIVFWIGMGIAFLIALALGLSSRVASVKWTALLLGGLAAVAISALPITRGYIFYGLADSLTHYGWAVQIQTGIKSPFEFIYPGAHLSSIIFQTTTGNRIGWAMMLVVLLTVVGYFIFVPLAVRAIVPKPAAVVVAAFSAYMLLPVNNVATHQMFHPFTLAAFMTPVMIYLVFKHVGGAADDDSLPSGMAATSLLMPLVGASLMFIHPQTTLNILIVLMTAVAVQVLMKRLWPNSRVAGYRIVYGQVILLTAFFMVWILQFWQTWAMLDGVIESFLATVAGTAEVGQNVNNTKQTGEGLGISLVELFLKMFLVSAVYCLVAAALVVAKVFRWIDSKPDRDVAIAYFAASGATLTPYFLLHFIGDMSGYFFRHVGFTMVLVTIIASAAIGSALDWSRGVGGIGKALRPVTGGAIAIALAASIIVAFSSPFIFLPNHGLSGQTADSFQTTFRYDGNAEEPVRWASVHGETSRYDDAFGQRASVKTSGPIPPEEITNLVGYYAGNDGANSGDHLLPVTERIIRQESEVYRAKDFSKKDFQSLEHQEGVHRVHSNSEVALYYIETRFNESYV